MKAYIFPGQGSQFPGMAKDLYDNSAPARELLEKGNEILGFRITDTMFNGTEEELKQSRITQPAIFLHSMAVMQCMGEDFRPDMVAGHSLGEYSALVANKTIRFEDALKLVFARGMAMQKACDLTPSTMAAILGLEDKIVENICGEIAGVVVPANYNCPGQLVISGEIAAVDAACEKLLAAGAKRALKLPVGGAFHSPLMEPARMESETAIGATAFAQPQCPVYQNVTARGSMDSDEIKSNLIKQMITPVYWTQTMQQMIADGCTEVIEVGPGKVLQGLFKKVSREMPVSSAVISVK
ncbi:MAG: ACP S-malonyltransferase [Crocinitomicaceae bacterium]|nr:ACP S-malonyltransferase [Crocinitomicaceae bacterium]